MKLRIANIGEDDFRLIFSSLNSAQQEPIPNNAELSNDKYPNDPTVLDLIVTRDEMIKVLVNLVGKGKIKTDKTKLSGLLTQEKCIDGLDRKESDEFLLFIFFQLLWIQHDTNNFPAVGADINIAIYESNKNKLLKPLTYSKQDKVRAALYIVLENLFVEKEIIFSKYVNFNKNRSIQPEPSYINAMLSSGSVKRTSITDSFADKDVEAYKLHLPDVRSYVENILFNYLFRLQFITISNLVSVGEKEITDTSSVSNEIEGDGSILSWLEFE